MTVIELVRKYGLEDFAKSYKNVYGNAVNLKNLDELARTEVKSVSVNLLANTAEITILDY